MEVRIVITNEKNVGGFDGTSRVGLGQVKCRRRQISARGRPNLGESTQLDGVDGFMGALFSQS